MGISWWLVFSVSAAVPSMGVGEGVGTGEGDSVSWSSVPRFFPSLDLAMTIWAFSASCSRDFILGEERHRRVRRTYNTRGRRGGRVRPRCVSDGSAYRDARTVPTGRLICPSHIGVETPTCDITSAAYPSAAVHHPNSGVTTELEMMATRH